MSAVQCGPPIWRSRRLAHPGLHLANRAARFNAELPRAAERASLDSGHDRGQRQRVRRRRAARHDRRRVVPIAHGRAVVSRRHIAGCDRVDVDVNPNPSRAWSSVTRFWDQDLWAEKWSARGGVRRWGARTLRVVHRGRPRFPGPPPEPSCDGTRLRDVAVPRAVPCRGLLGAQSVRRSLSARAGAGSMLAPLGPQRAELTELGSPSKRGVLIVQTPPQASQAVKVGDTVSVTRPATEPPSAPTTGKEGTSRLGR